MIASLKFKVHKMFMLSINLPVHDLRSKVKSLGRKESLIHPDMEGERTLAGHVAEAIW